MTHGIYCVTKFVIIGPYQLRVSFDDGVVQEIDFFPMLAGTMYSPLKELAFFNQVRIDPECSTLVWPNGADFDPEILHDWPELAAGLAKRARRWEREAEARKSGGSSVRDPIPRVSAFEIIGPYQLRVSFDDGVVREIDFYPVLAGTMFLPLKDLDYFNQVQIEPHFHTLVWPNDADFSPETLHDWPEHAERLEQWARRWERERQQRGTGQ